MTVRVGLVVHHDRPLALSLAYEVRTWLEAEGHEVRTPPGDTQVVGAAASANDTFADGLDVALSVGGDGTMLRTVALVCRSGVPVLGINMGHLGYLTEVEPAQWRDALGNVLAGRYTLEERMTLDVALRRADGTSDASRTALNDAVVEKLEAGHTVRVGVTVSGEAAVSYAADALIVSTPTGSTAYNLSAGGPVVSPRMAAVLVTPVAAHSLFGRALVVASDELVSVQVLAGSAVLGVDGRHCGRLCEGDVIECRASPFPARLISFGTRDFWRVIGAKFGLSAPPANATPLTPVTSP